MKAIPYLTIFPCLLFGHVVQGQEILPGSWNIEMALFVGNETPIPAKGATICLNSLDEVVKAGAGCSVNTTSTSGSQVNMNISCDVHGLKMDGTGSLTVSQTTVNGTLKLAMQMGKDQPVTTLSTLHAMRVGDCQK